MAERRSEFGPGCFRSGSRRFVAAVKSYIPAPASTSQEEGNCKREIAYLHLNKLRRSNQRHPRPPLHPHPPIRLSPLPPRPPRLPPTLPHQPRQRIHIPERIARPVFQTRVDDLELEGEEVLEDVGAGGGGLDGVKGCEEVCCFCGGLVEETEAGEGGDAEVP